MYDYIQHRAHIDQRLVRDDRFVMFTSLTDPTIMQMILEDMRHSDGTIKCVLCSSSFSTGFKHGKYKICCPLWCTLAHGCVSAGNWSRSREVDVHAHSIVLAYPKMMVGRKVDATMQTYAKTNSCRREHLLAHYNMCKPLQQPLCCDNC